MMADFVGNSRHPTDFGLKELLWDSDEDGFWEYFSKFEEESQAELARYPLTFPIPPTVQVGASTSASSATPAPPPPSMTTITIIIYGDIQWEHTHQEPLNDEDLDRFIEQQKKNKNKILNAKLEVILEKFNGINGVKNVEKIDS